MRPDIPPKAIKPHLSRRRPRARDFKDAPRDPQRRVRRHDLHAGNPLRQLAPLRRRDVPRCAVVGVDICDLCAGDVGEGFRGAEVSEEGAVAGEDVGF